MIIEGRNVNVNFVAEIGSIEPYIELKEKDTPLGSTTEVIRTGKFFFTIFFTSIKPINIIRNNKEEIEKEMEIWEKRLNGYMK